VIVTNSASLAGQSFNSVTWNGCRGDAPHFNANGTVTLTGVKAGKGRLDGLLPLTVGCVALQFCFGERT